MIRIDPRQLQILNDHELPTLVNDLIRAELTWLKLPPTTVDTNINTKARDGGVDCYIRDAITSEAYSSDWVPTGNSAWQYKSGKCPSVTDLIKMEFVKSGVLEAFKRGDTYCFVAADSLTPGPENKKQEIKDAIKAIQEQNGFPVKEPCVYDGNDLAQWAEKQVFVAASHFGYSIDNWQLFTHWSSPSRFKNSYIEDEQRKDLIGRIQDTIHQREKFLRITGRAGMGKTRLVMEALRPSEFQPYVWYLDDAAKFSYEFLGGLQRNSSGFGILVIDETESSEVERIRNFGESLPEGYTIIAIGPSVNGANQSNMYELGVMNVDQLAEVIGQFAPQISKNARRAIAERCGGSPKLVQVIGEAIAKSQSITSWQQIEQSPDVIEFLNQRLFPVNNTRDESILMRGISLFTKLGWQAELASDGKYVYSFLGLTEMKAKAALIELKSRGIVTQRGRFVYPTPDVLANYLARSTIEQMLGDRLPEFYNGLSVWTRKLFAERIEQVSLDPKTKDVVIKILKENSFFSELEELSSQGKAELLQHYAMAFPNVVLSQLERLIDSASYEKLVNFRQGRREVIWALESLAWWGDWFPSASRLMLRLASAENESYSNNATGVWVNFYQVVLSGTEIPFWDRYPFLEEALLSRDANIRLLGVKALGRAVEMRFISRAGGVPRVEGRLPSNEWKPNNNDEWRKIITGCLARLGDFLIDDDEGIRREVRNILAEQGYTFATSDLIDDWALLVTKLTSESYEHRKPFLDVVNLILSREEGLDENTKKKLVELGNLLRGDSLNDKLKFLVGSWPHELEEMSTQKSQDGISISELAHYAIVNPLVITSNLDWLFDANANSGFLFGIELGKLDEKSFFLDQLIGKWIESNKDGRFIGGYFEGAKQLHGVEWLEESLDSWLRQPELASLIAVVTWRSLSTQRAAQRICVIMQNRNLPGSFLGNLVYGFWSRNVPVVNIKELIKASEIDKNPESVLVRLGFIDQYLTEYPTLKEQLEEEILQALKDCLGVSLPVMGSYHWNKLAEHLVSYRYLDIAHIAMDIISYEGDDILLPSDEVVRILSLSLRYGKREVFEEVIGPALESKASLTWRLELPFKEVNLFSEIDPALLVSWIDKDVENRLGLISRFAPLSNYPLPELTKALLVRWGNNKNLTNSLHARFFTASWSGPASLYWQGKLEVVKKWKEDKEINVRRWAEEVEIELNRMIERNLLEEDEGY